MGIAPVIAAYASSKLYWRERLIFSCYVFFSSVFKCAPLTRRENFQNWKWKGTTPNAIITVNQEKIQQTEGKRKEKRYYLNWTILRIWKCLFFPTWQSSSNSGSNFMSFKSPFYECLSTNCYISFLVDDLPRGK